MALERLFQISIETMIDVSLLLIKYLKLGVPSDDENLFDLLSEILEHTALYKEMKRFRNVLVHQYTKINEKIVFSYARDRVYDFSIFINEVKQVLANKKK